MIPPRKTIITGLKKSFVQNESDAELHLRTEKDLPLKWVTVACGILVVLTFFFYWLITGSFILSLAGALFLALVAFFFAAVAGYIAGVVGSSNSPVSGMTIATLLFTVGLVWIVTRWCVLHDVLPNHFFSEKSFFCEYFFISLIVLSNIILTSVDAATVGK